MPSTKNTGPGLYEGPPTSSSSASLMLHNPHLQPVPPAQLSSEGFPIRPRPAELLASTPGPSYSDGLDEYANFLVGGASLGPPAKARASFTAPLPSHSKSNDRPAPIAQTTPQERRRGNEDYGTRPSSFYDGRLAPGQRAVVSQDSSRITSHPAPLSSADLQPYSVQYPPRSQHAQYVPQNNIMDQQSLLAEERNDRTEVSSIASTPRSFPYAVSSFREKGGRLSFLSNDAASGYSLEISEPSPRLPPSNDAPPRNDGRSLPSKSRENSDQGLPLPDAISYELPSSPRSPSVRDMEEIERRELVRTKESLNKRLSSIMAKVVRGSNDERRTVILADVLEDVAAEGNLGLVLAALTKGADPQWRRVAEREPHKALQLAAKGGHARVVHELLERGAQFGIAPESKKGKDGEYYATPTASHDRLIRPMDAALLRATRNGHMELAWVLIEKHGADAHVHAFLHTGNSDQPEDDDIVETTSFVSAISQHRTNRDALDLLARIEASGKLHAGWISHALRHPPKPASAGELDTQKNPSGRIEHMSPIDYFTYVAWSRALEIVLRSVPHGSRVFDPSGLPGDSNWAPSAVAHMTWMNWKHRAASTYRILMLLMDKGANINRVSYSIDHVPHHPLYHAIIGGSLKGTLALLDAYPDMLLSTYNTVYRPEESHYYSALGLALFYGQWVIAQALCGRNGAFANRAFEKVTERGTASLDYVDIALSGAGKDKSPPNIVLDLLLRRNPPLERLCSALRRSAGSRQRTATHMILSHYASRIQDRSLQIYDTSHRANLVRTLILSPCPVEPDFSDRQQFVQAERTYTEIVDDVTNFCLKRRVTLAPSRLLCDCIEHLNPTILQRLVATGILDFSSFSRSFYLEGVGEVQPLVHVSQVWEKQKHNKSNEARYSRLCRLLAG
ncbi:hypothetical protein GQ53DRAFT_750572 [Thozetella sp. PMI_491]|nr:hypothetical protein GQ53DRAFT_750572 [Thozetella sp. PMI_491]